MTFIDKTQKTIHAYDISAKTFQDKFMDLELYTDSFEHFFDILDQKSKILDLGCGPGNVSKYLLDKNPDLDISGIDLSEKMIELARKNVPGANFELCDIRKLDFKSKSFDAVVAAFCLPSLNNDEATALIQNISRIVKPGGIVYMSCMEGTRSGFETTSFTDQNKIFINYYEESFLLDAFAKNGFEIEKKFRQDYPEADGSVTIDMIFISRLSKPAFQ